MGDAEPPARLVQKLSQAENLSKEPMEAIQTWLDLARLPQFDHYDKHLLEKVKLISAEPGKAVFEFTVTKDMCNAGGSIHGGCAATLMDDLTSMPVHTLAKPGFLDAGTVSRTLTCTYLRPIVAGQKVKVVCEAVAVGKTLCHVRGDMILEDGKVAITCTHDKAQRAKPKL